ncbi:glycerol-3-phosphate dehydrogenase [Paracoccus sp. S-4012]|uniref:NAD/NADP-dependent octopine/nopaline dehydrogenase family protein n=1 Tax=Paracoccus sp. S-4012 TaxID=2665648 RepID=UPI0012AFBE86|nr:NAD/NADP-dependent octopine/nopaline dehydrogenase family protein [Paracoccus sp. S-4012]MRX52292.1 glycerol-3-phosphate dehydrogenase [Paracoccus sp. S-4012]
MLITIIGGGNGAFAAVADLTEASHEVRWWRRGGDHGLHAITVQDYAGTRQVPARATDDLGAALAGAQLILVPLPATAQEDVARALAPHLAAGQTVVAMPGSLGSVVMAKAARAARPQLPAGLRFAETGSLPWITRKAAEDTITITTRGTLMTLGTSDGEATDEVADLLREAFPGVTIDARRDALDAALTNGNPVLHTPLVLMNAGVIAAGGPFEPHGEGTQGPIRAVQDALDAERIAIRETLGYAAPHYPLADFYGPGVWFYDRLGQDLPQVAPQPHERIDFVSHRYVAEDIVIGLALLVSLAHDYGIEAPLARGFLAQASAILGRDLRDVPDLPPVSSLAVM